MPEKFITYRLKFKNLSDNWQRDFNSLTIEQQGIAKDIILTNNFNTITEDGEINLILNK